MNEKGARPYGLASNSTYENQDATYCDVQAPHLYAVPCPSPDYGYAEPLESVSQSIQTTSKNHNPVYSDAKYLDLYPQPSIAERKGNYQFTEAQQGPTTPVYSGDFVTQLPQPEFASNIKEVAVYSATRQNSEQSTMLLRHFSNEDVDGYLDFNGDVYLSADDLRRSSIISTSTTSSNEDYVFIHEDDGETLYVRIESNDARDIIAKARQTPSLEPAELGVQAGILRTKSVKRTNPIFE